MSINVIDLGPRYAFVNVNEDKTYCVVIVGHTERCLPESGAVEVLDANILPTHKAAFEWLRQQEGFAEARPN